jgi:hypothetical protein
MVSTDELHKFTYFIPFKEIFGIIFLHSHYHRFAPPGAKAHMLHITPGTRLTPLSLGLYTAQPLPGLTLVRLSGKGRGIDIGGNAVPSRG